MKLKPSELLITLLLLVTAGALLFSTTTSAQSLAYTLQGKILLQVEENGEAWYVYPASLERYYLGRPEDAFEIMRTLGLGISNANLDLIPEDTQNTSFKHDRDLMDRLSGSILLQVEENGEAWYVNPENQKRYYLGRPADAFEIMRNLGLGISNKNLLNVPVSIDSKLPETNNSNGTSTTVNPELNDNHDATRSTLLNSMNQERVANSVDNLQLAKELSLAAQAQVDDMVSNNYFDFTSPSGKGLADWVEGSGYAAHVIAENIIQTNQGLSSVVTIWKNDNGTSYHNIIDPQYKEVGVGVGEYQGVPVYVVMLAYSLEDFFNDNVANLADLNQVRAEMLASVNLERSKVGLSTLVVNDLLNTATQNHTDDMLGRSYYGHESPEGSSAHDRIKLTGYDPMFSGENIAKGQFSVEEVMIGWMNSPGHKANILGADYTEVGFGLSFGTNQNGYEVIWGQNFAKPF